jgi:RNA polymerase sigma-70 factor (ECF subfamily)
LKAEDAKEQFDRLVAPHLERLYRVGCRLLGNPVDAQDLVQDTCVAACEHLEQLEGNTHPLRWLLRVQHNRFIDGARRRKRVPIVALDMDARAAGLVSAEPGPEELLQQSESERALERAFQQLDDTQRVLLTLRAEGHGLDEIEAITGIGREVLRARLHRARRSLAQKLDDADRAPARVPRIGSGT